MQTLNWKPKYNQLKYILKTAYEWEKKIKQISNNMRIKFRILPKSSANEFQIQIIENLNKQIY